MPQTIPAASYLRSPTAWLAALVSIAILLLGARAILDPVSASASFGLPMHTDTETTFVRVYGARNAFLGALSIGFITQRMIKPLALLFMLATTLPLLDAFVIVSRIGPSHELVRHAAIFVLLVVTSLSLWRLSREV